MDFNVRQKIVNIAEAIFEQRAPAVQPEWLAEILSRLVWLTADNGSEIMRTLEEWLEGDNPEKIAVALAFDEAFLFRDISKAEEVFSALTIKFPEFSANCDEILKRRLKLKA